MDNQQQMLKEIQCRTDYVDEWQRWLKYSGEPKSKITGTQTIFSPEYLTISTQELHNRMKSVGASVCGIDNRKDLKHIKDSRIKRAASGVAAIVPMDRFKLRGGKYHSKLESLRQVARRKYGGIRLCDSVPFQSQPSMAIGTAFLVSDDTVLTAGHIFRNANVLSIRGFGFLFDFVIDQGRAPNGIFETGQLFRAKSIEYKTHDRSGDWALIRLDRKVPADYHIQSLNTNQVLSNTPISVIGFPLGLPLKYADDAITVDVEQGRPFFNTTLDIFHRNSGSPVYDHSMRVVGIVIRTSGRFLRAHDDDDCYVPQQFCIDPQKRVLCQKIDKTIINKI